MPRKAAVRADRLSQPKRTASRPRRRFSVVHTCLPSTAVPSRRFSVNPGWAVAPQTATSSCCLPLWIPDGNAGQRQPVCQKRRLTDASNTSMEVFRKGTGSRCAPSPSRLPVNPGLLRFGIAVVEPDRKEYRAFPTAVPASFDISGLEGFGFRRLSSKSPLPGSSRLTVGCRLCGRGHFRPTRRRIRDSISRSILESASSGDARSRSGTRQYSIRPAKAGNRFSR